MSTTITTTTSTTPNTSFGYPNQVSAGLKVLMTQSGTVSAILANLYKNGSPTGTLKVGLQADSAGVPSNIFLDYGTISIASLGAGSGNKADYTFTFSGSVSVTNGTNYWVVMTPDNTLDGVNWIIACGAGSGTYNGGVEKLANNSQVWADDTGYDRHVLTINDIGGATLPYRSLLGVGI